MNGIKNQLRTLEDGVEGKMIERNRKKREVEDAREDPKKANDVDRLRSELNEKQNNYSASLKQLEQQKPALQQSLEASSSKLKTAKDDLAKYKVIDTVKELTDALQTARHQRNVESKLKSIVNTIKDSPLFNRKSGRQSARASSNESLSKSQDSDASSYKEPDPRLTKSESALPSSSDRVPEVEFKGGRKHNEEMSKALQHVMDPKHTLSEKFGLMSDFLKTYKPIIDKDKSLKIRVDGISQHLMQQIVTERQATTPTANSTARRGISRTTASSNASTESSAPNTPEPPRKKM